MEFSDRSQPKSVTDGESWLTNGKDSVVTDVTDES